MMTSLTESNCCYLGLLVDSAGSEAWPDCIAAELFFLFTHQGLAELLGGSGNVKA
jgi:hypothetical protein